MSEKKALAYLYQDEVYQVKASTIIVLAQPWSSLSENDVTTLTKIVTAIKLTMATVRIIERATFTLQDIIVLSPHKVISFGATLQPQAEYYQPLNREGVDVILADALPALDDVKKKNLWLGLRKMYGI
jgi:hypothetical protein